MTIIFWICAAAMMSLAVVLLLRPLLREERSAGLAQASSNVELLQRLRQELDAELQAGLISKEQFEIARQELERRALDESIDVAVVPRAETRSTRKVVMGVLAALPPAAVAIYFGLGSPGLIDKKDAAAALPAGHPSSGAQITLEEAAEKLAKRLKEKPDDPVGWELLARSFAELHQYAHAATAFEEAAKRNPKDAQLLADYADAAAMANERRFDGKPTDLIARALKIDPKNAKALWLAGTLAYEAKDFRKALGLWKRLIEVVPADSEIAKQIQSDVAELQVMLGEKPAPVLATAKVEKPVAIAAGGAQVSGRVELSPSLAAQAKATDTVFVYARPINGPKMPLAIMKATVADLPLQFTLDDSLAMAPMAKISNHQEVMLLARVSRSSGAVHSRAIWKG